MDFNNIEEIRNFLNLVEEKYSKDRDYLSKSCIFTGELSHNNLLRCIDKLVTMDVKYFDEFKDHPFWENYKSHTNSYYVVSLIKRNIDNPWIEKILNLHKILNSNYYFNNSIYYKDKISFKFLNQILNFNKNDIKYINFLKEKMDFKIEVSEYNYFININFLNNGDFKLTRFFWEENLYLDIFKNKNLLNNFTESLIYNNLRDPIAKLKHLPKALYDDNFLISLHSAFRHIYSQIFIYYPNNKNNLAIKDYLLKIEDELIERNLKNELRDNILFNFKKLDFYNCKNIDHLKDYLKVNFEKKIFDRIDIPEITNALTGIGRYSLIKVEELNDICFNIEMKKELLSNQDFKNTNKRKF